MSLNALPIKAISWSSYTNGGIFASSPWARDPAKEGLSAPGFRVEGRAKLVCGINTFGVGERMEAKKIEYNAHGERIVPDRPVIPYIEGDGVGPDIWKAAVRVFDAAVEACYGRKRKVEWLEVYAGEKAFRLKGDWAPEETIETI